MMRFGVEDSLIGDIQEMASRSSVLWVWRQAAGAIVVGIRKDFQAHWVLAIRAAVFGMFVWKLLFPTVSTVLWHFTTGFSGLGLLIGLTHPDIHAATVLTMLLGVPAMVCLGWAIGRLHPTRTPMPVLAFLVAVYATWIFPYSRQLSNAIGDSRFRPYLFTQTLSVCIFTLGVLAGGIWRSGQQRHVAVNMSRNGITALSTVIASLLIVGSLYAATDVSGRWEVEATFDDPSLAAGGFECVFKQAAERLTGSCSDGTALLTGEVEGQTITWRAAITTFTGTLSAVGTSIEGRFSAGGNDGTFRAAKL
ncbi:MAG TPA: hypothetical protein VF456_06100 [Vicinamibacterales bacterium]